MPAAAAEPVKNSAGNAQMGAQLLSIPDATKHKRSTVRREERVVIVLSNMNEIAPAESGMAA